MIYIGVSTKPNTETLTPLPLHILLQEEEHRHFIKKYDFELQTNIRHRAL